MAPNSPVAGLIVFLGAALIDFLAILAALFGTLLGTALRTGVGFFFFVVLFFFGLVFFGKGYFLVLVIFFLTFLMSAFFSLRVPLLSFLLWAIKSLLS